MEKLIIFRPDDELVFANTENPSREVQITNKWNRQIMFKLKSTRPGVLHMRPVFGTVNPEEVVKLTLSIRSKNLSELTFTEKDHFTCVFCPTPANITKVSAEWKLNTAKEIRHLSARKVLKIKTEPKDAASSETSSAKVDKNANSIQGQRAAKTDKIPSKSNVLPQKSETARTLNANPSKTQENDDSSSSSSEETEKSTK